MIAHTYTNFQNTQNTKKLVETIDLSNLDISKVFDLICLRSLKKINYFWLGYRDYSKMWEIQTMLQEKVKNNEINDVVLFLEHNPVYTLGRNADKTNLLPNKPNKIQVIQTDRGGDVTFHGPGQLIGYPIVDLKRYNKSITWFMRGLESSIISMLSAIGIHSSTKDKLTGVWVENDKIAALGVRLSKWVSMHGFAINVNTDLKLYKGIVPCGISDLGLTSIKKINQREYGLYQIAISMSKSLDSFFNETNGGRNA